jgi:hypothetical protein
MRIGHLATALVAVAVAGGCAMGGGPAKKNILVYGESFASTDEAVAEARLAMQNAAGHGCKAISVGNGDGLAGDPESGGRMISVVVLLECPGSTPDLLAATGLAP